MKKLLCLAVMYHIWFLQNQVLHEGLIIEVDKLYRNICKHCLKTRLLITPLCIVYFLIMEWNQACTLKKCFT